MKTLSIKQPFAELILQGKKKIELRKWNAKFRGEFLIHAPQNPDVHAMHEFGFYRLPLGCIVGKAILTDVKRYEDEENHRKDNHLHLASSAWGNYGFMLEKPERVVVRAAVKGALGFWEYPESI